MSVLEEITSLKAVVKSYLLVPLISYIYLAYHNFLFWLCVSLGVLSWIFVGINIAFIGVIKYKSKDDENKEDEEIKKHPRLAFLQSSLVFNALVNLIFLIIYFFLKKDFISLIFSLVIIAGFAFLITGTYLVKERVFKTSKEAIDKIKSERLLKGL